METLDTPISLHYKNGKVFPANAVFMGYVFIAVALFVFVFANIYFGIAGLLIAVFMVFTNYGTQINPDTKMITEYTKYLGFIKIGKSYDYSKYHFLSVIPVKQTTTMYSRSSSSTSTTDYFFAIYVLHGNYRSKREITRFEQKSEALDVTKNLAYRMSLEYFEYDPKVIREKLAGR